MEKKGSINRIIFHNDSNGYTVAVFDTDEGAIRVAGSFAAPKVGASYKLEGNFVIHYKFGEQFAFTSYEEVAPEGVEAIKAFLSSGVIKGIGPKIATAIVDAFGEDALRVIEEEPDKLLSIKRIGETSLNKIKTSFDEMREFAKVSLELQNLGIEVAASVKIYEMYGASSVDVVKENPYVLVDDIQGIGFEKADKIAEKVGLDMDAEPRIKCGIKTVLQYWASQGSTLVPEQVLIDQVVERLDSSAVLVENTIADMSFSGEIQSDIVEDAPVVYLYDYFHAEQRTCHNLRQLKNSRNRLCPKNIDDLITEAEEKLRGERENMQLSDKQREAVKVAFMNNVTIITGGPGTGKTTIINVIVKILEKLGAKVSLAAPTGRAAKRMEEASGVPANTIHRLLEYAYSDAIDDMIFMRNDQNLIEADAIIIDEASMIDIQLMDALLFAIARGTKLIITGDADQLPSVGPGNVLRDIIRSEYIETVRLKEIFRQAEGSLISSNAQMINEGEYPYTRSGDQDFYISHEDSELAILENIKSLIDSRLINYFDFIESANDIQVLTPTKKGLLGVHNLNSELQAVINPPAPNRNELKYGTRIFREGDRVMQLKNLYEAEWKDLSTKMTGTGIFNGDMGVITEIDEVAKTMSVEMDGKLVVVSGEMFEHIDLAYAITVHKSQGCEFPAVIIPMWSFPPMLMTRNLLYTAVTRGKKLVIIDGNEQKIQTMIDNNRNDERYTGLKFRLETIDDFA